MTKFINMCRTGIMYFIHHFIRVIWSSILEFIYFIIYAFKYYNSPNTRFVYGYHKREWESIKSIDALIHHLTNYYIYKYDGKFGLLDHNNSKLEWHIGHGDCDDVARYSYMKLKESYKSDELEYCKVHGFSDLFAKFWHYDVIYKFANDDNYYLFNYGRPKCIGNSLSLASNAMMDLYKRNKDFTKLGVINWKCNWM